jgi:hypothetical protein
MPIDPGDWQQLSTVQGPAAPKPVTMASAATIVPTTFLTVLTGNVAITSITPPFNLGHMIAIQFAGTAGITAGNNITTTKASVVGEVMLLVFNPVTAKYVPVG